MNLTIRQKLLGGFGLMFALSLAIGWYALNRLAEATDVTQLAADHDAKELGELQKITAAQDRMKILREQALVQALLQRSRLSNESAETIQVEWRTARTKTTGLLTDFRDAAARYEQIFISQERETHWHKLRQTADQAIAELNALSAEVEKQFKSANRGDLEAVVQRSSVVAQSRERFDGLIDDAVTTTEELVQAGKTASQNAYAAARISIFVALLVTLAIAAVASTLIQRAIIGPLVEFMGLTEAVGAGDLSRRARDQGRDEFARLGQSLNKMVAGLRNLTEQTRTATENLNSASAEIVASTQQQASSATEQAASVQETTTTMQEVSQSGKQIAARAKEVAGAAEAGTKTSDAGLRAAEDTTRTMDSIREQAEVVAEHIVTLSEKTQAIGEIIALVNDVAEQSNLVALNAAIEATAAGEQGRRFSVVANEIKNLADQSKTATTQVRSILGDIQKGINTLVMLTEEAVKRVESGKQQADVAQATIRQMADTTREAVVAFQQITAATNQQQIGLDQVNQALHDIRQASQQTAAGTGQMEKAAMSLNALSQQLQQAVARYQL